MPKSFDDVRGRQLTLGALTDALSHRPGHLPVHIRGGLYDGCTPGDLGSHRSFHDELAISPEFQCESATVDDLLAACRAADGAWFDSWKDTPHLMTTETPVWVSVHGSGDATPSAITRVERAEFGVDLVTEHAP